MMGIVASGRFYLLQIFLSKPQGRQNRMNVQTIGQAMPQLLCISHNTQVIAEHIHCKMSGTRDSKPTRMCYYIDQYSCPSINTWHLAILTVHYIFPLTLIKSVFSDCFYSA